MNILIVTQDYPDVKRSVYTFVKQLVDQFALMGHCCCVISPYSITQNRSFYKDKENDGGVIVLRPNHLSFSNWSFFGVRPSLFFRKRALNKALNDLPFVPDVIYAHFWLSGIEIFEYAKQNSIPLFVATGESVISQKVKDRCHKEFCDYVSGVICVSTKNKEESLIGGLTTEEKCVIIPNAINPNKFYFKERKDCRRKLNIPDDIFIVAFCGALCHRKGVKILSAAIDSIKSSAIFSFFIGRPMGETPTCSNILHQGAVRHDELINLLNAADVFVLPTLHEGCCNAIVEAMACGLPIISSDRSFNWDILDKRNSILVDPENHLSVAEAITTLRDNESLRKQLSEGALKRAQELTIEKRANKIIEFIESKLNGVIVS